MDTRLSTSTFQLRSDYFYGTVKITPGSYYKFLRARAYRITIKRKHGDSLAANPPAYSFLALWQK